LHHISLPFLYVHHVYWFTFCPRCLDFTFITPRFTHGCAGSRRTAAARTPGFWIHYTAYLGHPARAVAFTHLGSRAAPFRARAFSRRTSSLRIFRIARRLLRICRFLCAHPIALHKHNTACTHPCRARTPRLPRLGSPAPRFHCHTIPALSLHTHCTRRFNRRGMPRTRVLLAAYGSP